MSTKETVIRNEIVRVKGKVKAITVPKEKTQEILRRVELRMLDKKYEVLMPPSDGMEKNNIDLQGMMTFIGQYASQIISGIGTSETPPNYAQIVITTTSGSKVQLNFTGNILSNTQGMSATMQIFGTQNSMNVQYYFIGYDTTNNSYQGNYLELYSSSFIQGATAYTFTTPVRIAYANLSINKLSDYDLFILWMIEFQNVPPYLIVFIPTIPGSPTVSAFAFRGGTSTGASFTVYANNGNCNFSCNGNCPSGSPGNLMLSVQNNTIVLQIPVLVAINGGTSSAQVLICGTYKYVYVNYMQGPNGTISFGDDVTFSTSYSTTIAPPSSGYIFVALLAVIAITFTVS